MICDESHWEETGKLLHPGSKPGMTIFELNYQSEPGMTILAAFNVNAGA